MPGGAPPGIPGKRWIGPFGYSALTPNPMYELSLV